jgi:hypothetical protein
MAGRVLYKRIDITAGGECVKPVTLSKIAQSEIEKLIERTLTADEISSISTVLTRAAILMVAESANSSLRITSQDIRRTLTNISKLAPCEAFPAYQKVKIIRDIIDEVMRMELGIYFDRGSEELMLALGLNVRSTSEEFTNVLGSSIKKAAVFAL